MANDLLSKIQKQFEPNQLFAIADINDSKLDPATLKQRVVSLARDGKLVHFSYGFYYIPGKITDPAPSSLDAIESRYLGSGKNIIGFYTGLNYLEHLKGIRPSLDEPMELMTNKATSGKKTIYIFQKRLTLRKPYYKIDSKNVNLNSFLSFIALAPLSLIKENYSILSNYIKKNQLSANDVMDLAAYFPAKTASKLLSSDLYRSLWKH